MFHLLAARSLGLGQDRLGLYQKILGMAKHPKSGVAVPIFHLRRGEGTPVSVVSKLLTAPDGTSRQSHGINLSEAEVPNRRYLADVCGVAYEDELVKLMFAQRRRSITEMRSLIIISMTPLAAATFLESVKAMKKPSLEEIVSKFELPATQLADFKTEPDQTVELVANIVAAAFSGRETCLDFYHASSFAFVSLASTNRLALDPVVRVDLRTTIFNALIKRLREIQAEFPADAIFVKDAE